MLNHARRATLALTTSAVLTIGLTTGPAAHAAPSKVTPQAAKAADWLAGQLEDGLAASSYYDGEADKWVSYTDHGLTLDFFLALDALDVKKKVRGRMLDAIEPQMEWYTGSGNTAYAGAHGKLLTALQAQGVDPSTYASGDLVQRLEELVHTGEDTENGRAKDTFDPTSEWGRDNSNTLGQAFVARALTGAGSPLADETVQFLLKQQCSEGFFRVYMNSSDNSCDAGTGGQSTPSVDATAAAVLALVEVRDARVDAVAPKTVKQALGAARAWLLAQQKKNGSFADEGVANSNSTGLAAQALAALGRERPAAKAASWVAKLRVTAKLVKKSSFRKRDIGAVAFSRAALKEGRSKGITTDVRYQWRRSTAQAAPALDFRR